MEQLLDQLPEDQPIMINRIFSARKKDRTTHLWVVQVGAFKRTGSDLLFLLREAKQFNERSS